MAMTPEAAVKMRVKKMLDSMSIYYFMPFGTIYGRAGIPDIVCCANGLFAGIECKAGKNVPTALQERELTKIRDAGGFTWVAREDNLDALKEELTKWLKRYSARR
jgi:hypothetical protein